MVQNRAGENLGRGIEQFGQGIGRLFDSMKEEKERLKKEGQLADKMRGIADILDPESKDKHKLMAPGQIEGKVEGLFAQSRMRKEQAQLAESQSQQKLIAAQIEKMKQADEQQRQLANVYSELGKRGQAPESVPSPVSNEAFDQATAPVTPSVIAGIIGQQGGGVPSNAFDDIVRAFATKAQTGWNLKPGETLNVGGRELVPVSPNSYQVMDDPKKKAVAPNVPWLLSDDTEEFNAGVRSLTDPVERDAALQARAAFMRAQDHENPMWQLIADRFGDGSGMPRKKPTAKPAAAPNGAPPKYTFDAQTGNWKGP